MKIDDVAPEKVEQNDEIREDADQVLADEELDGVAGGAGVAAAAGIAGFDDDDRLFFRAAR